MANVIDIRDFIDPKEELKELLNELEGSNKYLTAKRDELKNFDISGPLCIICDEDFTDDEKIFVEERFVESDEPSVYLVYHRECFESYLNDPEPTMEDMGNTVYSPNVCALCEQTFEEDLPFNDGDAYFCEECAKSFGNLPKAVD